MGLGDGIVNNIKGENTLRMGHFGHFKDMYVMYIFANMGFTFGV
jgi:hypothetical protein